MDTTARSAYLGASVGTASPARLLVMLCERLVLDVRRGVDAQADGQPAAANQHLQHAQDIVLELRHTLRTDTWEGAAQLAQLYEFLLTELVRANVSRDPGVTRGCLALCEQLADTWREAALAAAAAPAVAG